MSGYAEAFSAAVQTTIQMTSDLGALAQEPTFLVSSVLALSGVALAALTLTQRSESTGSFDGLAQPAHALPSGSAANLGAIEARVATSSAEATAQGCLGVSTPGGGE